MGWSKWLKGILLSIKERSYNYLEDEIYEMQNSFALLVLGGIVGFPFPFSILSLELLPDLEQEIGIMLSRIDDDEIGRLSDFF